MVNLSTMIEGCILQHFRKRNGSGDVSAPDIITQPRRETSENIHRVAMISHILSFVNIFKLSLLYNILNKQILINNISNI